MTLGIEVGLGPGDIVLDGDPAPPPKQKASPHFWPMYCGQTAGWIKMSVGTEVGLGPGDIVLDSKPALPPRKGGGWHTIAAQLSVHIYLGQMAGWIKMPLGM